MDSNNGLRLLSLDGGGVRGLSELFILKNLMLRIKAKRNLKDEPLPCQYFDIIGGAGVGGIIALMLGRLGMSVSEAIDHYCSFIKKVFAGGRKYFGDGKYKASFFEDVIKEIIKGKTQVDDLCMVDNRWNGSGCKTFVCAALMNSCQPIRLCSYQHELDDKSPNCTIWEAARATSAAPTFFKSVAIGEGAERMSYVGGGIGYNNPAEIVVEEAELIYPDRSIACIISIGTGQPRVPTTPKSSIWQRLATANVVTTMITTAADCESRNQSMERRFRGKLSTYFRFNVEHDLQDAWLEEWNKLEEINAHTLAYLQTEEVDRNMDIAVGILSIQC